MNESTITDRITYLTNMDVLENKSFNNKDSYYLKDNTKDLETSHKLKLHILLIIHLKTIIMYTVL